MTFSPNSNVICAGFEDASVRLWSLNMKKLGQSSQKNVNTKPSMKVKLALMIQRKYLCERNKHMLI